MTDLADDLDVELADFHDRRAQGIGGSEVGMLTGDDPYGGLLTLWLRKTGRLQWDPPSSEAAEWGHVMENLILDRGQAKTGLTFGSRQEFFKHPTRPSLCHVDALGWSGSLLDAEPFHVAAVVDAKNSHSEPWPELPIRYELQIQHNLAVVTAVLGYPVERGIVVALHRGRTLKVYEVEADPFLQADLLDLEESFWRTYVATDTPPPADGKTGNDRLAHAFPADPGEKATVEPSLIAEWRAAVAARKDAQAEEDRLAEEIRVQLGTATEGIHPDTGELLVTWRPPTKGPYDDDLIRAAGIDPSTVRKPGPVDETLLRAAGVRGKALDQLRRPRDPADLTGRTLRDKTKD